MKGDGLLPIAPPLPVETLPESVEALMVGAPVKVPARNRDHCVGSMSR
jgi:hypothetical protein